MGSYQLRQNTCSVLNTLYQRLHRLRFTWSTGLSDRLAAKKYDEVMRADELCINPRGKRKDVLTNILGLSRCD